MPVILPPAAQELWLDPTVHDPERLRPLFTPCRADTLEVYPVARLILRGSTEGPKLIWPWRKEHYEQEE